MFSVPAKDFSLRHTLASGQSFRWAEHDGWFYGFLGPSPIKVRQQEDILFYETEDSSLARDRVKNYFAVDLDLAAVLASIDVDTQVHQAIQRYRGLRILRQDAWETLASFICAAFNNIKRIEGMMNRICQFYGRPISWNGFQGHDFPSAEAIAQSSERN
ncbi:MAG: 8-oxoguanine DNA glycosylase, partial [Anaerolineae bacterium]|nr:8-oxoguanine DNA glycosylase [Anaerolineae bacterium]